MKTSLKKLRGGFGIPKHQNKRERHLQQPLVKLDELSQAFQDMQDMRDCYDSLFSAAAATANSAYEFSESLREMGDCLLEKTALNDDEESGKVLLMLGKVQFSIQDLVDRYRSHIFQTITIPSESLLNELRIVEEMKKNCDEKRSVYEEMIPKCRGKGRLRSSKGGDHCSPRELQAARDEYEDDVSIFVFRMKSLKRGQSRSLLTQAARHHAAQMCFFSKALKSLEAIEPHVKFVTERQHIEYHFSGLEDDDDDDDDDGNDDDDDNDDDDNDDEIDDDSEDHDEGELSFDYGRQNDQGKDISTSRGDSMELDNVDLTFPKVSTMVDAVKEYSQRNSGRNSFIFGRDLDPSSKSAPLLVGKDSDPAGRFRPIRQSSSRKSYTYVLPTPNETKSPVSLQSETQVPQTRRASVSGGGTTLNNWWHSSPLEQKKSDDNLECQKFSGPILSKTQSVLRESNNNTTTSTRLPPPMTERRLSSQLDQRGDNKKIRRQAFSGPLAGNSWSNKSNLSASGPIGSTGNALLFSGSLLRTPLPRPSSSPLLSSSVSPTFMSSSPKISELHELPRPPVHLASKGPTNLRHSSPLLPKAQERSPTNKLMMPSNVTSKLPIPPQTVHRSFSIPSRGQRETELHVSNTLEASQNSKMSEDIASPPLTLFSLSETGAG